MRLFVDGLLQFGELSDDDREAISASLQSSGRSLEDTLAEASAMLSGLSSAAGVVMAPKADGGNLRHIEFVPLGHARALVILVSAEGQVENRVIDIPPGPAAFGIAAGLQLPQRPAVRPTAAGAAAGGGRGNGGQSDRARRTGGKVVEAGLATWGGALAAGPGAAAA